MDFALPRFLHSISTRPLTRTIRGCGSRLAPVRLTLAPPNRVLPRCAWHRPCSASHAALRPSTEFTNELKLRRETETRTLILRTVMLLSMSEAHTRDRRNHKLKLWSGTLNHHYFVTTDLVGKKRKEQFRCTSLVVQPHRPGQAHVTKGRLLGSSILSNMLGTEPSTIPHSALALVCIALVFR